jgi:N-acyl-D-amino-acid deacylase
MKIALLLGISALSLGAATPPAPQKVDLLIRGGTIYTGSDAPFTGDVAITGDHIVSVSKHANVTATRIIDAKGMIVAPGFIDPHTHMGGDLASKDPAKRLIPAFLMQGVTTAFIGNDGGGNPDLDKVLGSAMTKPVGINYAAYVGFGAVREKVVGEDNRAPTPDEMTKMKGLVADAMCHGAIGLSTGLFYAPQSFATTEEVIELAKEAGKRGGTYDSHIRDESSYTVGLAAAIDEAIRIGREGGAARAYQPHQGARRRRAGPRARDHRQDRGRARARREGHRQPISLVRIGHEPGRFARPALGAGWRASGAAQALRRSVAHREDARRHGREPAQARRGGQAADRRGQVQEPLSRCRGEGDELSPSTAAIAVIRIGDPGTVSFNQSEADIGAFMKQPWVMTGSDASGGHPRVYGTFARKYDKYVKTDHVISLREFIERSSALTADTFGLTGRGHLRSGAFADVVVFDPKTYASRATYEAPTEYAAGVQTVVVNGVVAVDKGAMTGKAAGRALPHKPTPGSCK